MTSQAALKNRILTGIVVALLLVSAVLWIQTQSVGQSPATIDADLLNHNKNDGKDNCPNDGNAGKGNDNKGPNGGCRVHPPGGGYGSIPN